MTDKEGLPDFVGTNALSVAGLSAIVAVAKYTHPFAGYEAIWIFYVLGVGLLTGRTIRGARKYETPQ